MAFPPTDWGDFTTDEYQVGAPGSSYSFERWFRNPVAMAQGAIGAPRLNAGAHGLAEKVAVDVSGTTDPGAVATFANIGIFAGFSFTGWLLNSNTAQTRQMRIRFSTNNGGSYGSWINLFTTQGTNANNRQFSVYFALNVLGLSLSYVTKGFENDGTNVNGAAGDVSVSVPDGANAFQLGYVTPVSGNGTIMGIAKMYGLLR